MVEFLNMINNKCMIKTRYRIILNKNRIFIINNDKQEYNR